MNLYLALVVLWSAFDALAFIASHTTGAGSQRIDIGRALVGVGAAWFLFSGV